MQDDKEICAEKNLFSNGLRHLFMFLSLQNDFVQIDMI